MNVLAEMSDSEIGCSDISALDESFWENAVQNPFYKPIKTMATVRVDSDVLFWLGSQGKRCQTRLNAILRQAMILSLHQDRKYPYPKPGASHK